MAEGQWHYLSGWLRGRIEHVLAGIKAPAEPSNIFQVHLGLRGHSQIFRMPALPE